MPCSWVSTFWFFLTCNTFLLDFHGSHKQISFFLIHSLITESFLKLSCRMRWSSKPPSLLFCLFLKFSRSYFFPDNHSKLKTPGQISGETVGEVKIVADMHERKSEMAKHADAFIALPGGFGTFGTHTNTQTHTHAHTRTHTQHTHTHFSSLRPLFASLFLFRSFWFDFYF